MVGESEQWTVSHGEFVSIAPTFREALAGFWAMVFPDDL